MSQHPTHPNQLSGSKWTAVTGDLPYRHWEVRRVDGEQAEMLAALDKSHVMRLPWRALRDREVWEPGWRR